MIRKIFSSAVAVGIAWSGLGALSISAAANDVDQLSPAASAAFADVGRCLTSGKSTELSVTYLIDASGSLAWTDPDNERQEIIEGSIEGLGEFAIEGIDVKVSAQLFSSSTTEILNWTSVESPDDAIDTANRVGASITNDNIGGTTDWEEGLEEAYSQLEPEDGCKMLIWFTDGGINPDNTYEGVESSLAALCHPGVSISDFGASTEYGFMERFRDAQIPVFGILYSNLEKAKKYFDENYPGEADSLLAEERWLMSFMQPIIEGSGVIPEEKFNGSTAASGQIKCASVSNDGVAPPEQTNGAFLNAQDPVGLAFQFLKLGSQISGGSANSITDGNFEIPPGTAKFVVVLAGENWSLTGPEGSGIVASDSQTHPAVRSRVTSGATAVTVSTAGSPEAFGVWSMEPKDAAVELFLYPGLTFSLDRDASSKILSDFDNTVTGRVVRTAEFSNFPVDLGAYPAAAITAEYLENGEWKTVTGVEIESSSNGEFSITGFNPPSGVELLDVKLSLDLGPDFNIVESRFALEVQDKSALVSASTDDLVLSPLVGPAGLARGSLTLTGPSIDSSSKFCFAEMMRLDDDQTGIEKVDRSEEFKWTFTDASSGESGTCFTVSKGEEKLIEVAASNAKQAPGEVVAVWNITAQTEGVGAQFEAPLRISFSSQVETNEAVKWLVFVALLAAGLLLPLGVMWLLNFATTKFLAVQGVSKVTYPVIIDATGTVLGITDARPGKAGKLVVEPRDFLGIADEKPVRRHKIGQGQATARIPAFPLGSTWYEWVAPPAQRIVTSNLRVTKSTKEMKAGKAVEVSPNLADNWAITVSDQQLLSGNKKELQAELTIFSPMSDLKGYQAKVDKVLSSNALKTSLAAATEAARLDAERAIGGSDGAGTATSEAPEISIPGAPPLPGSTPKRPPMGNPPGSAPSFPSSTPFGGPPSAPPNQTPPWLKGK